MRAEPKPVSPTVQSAIKRNRGYICPLQAIRPGNSRNRGEKAHDLCMVGRQEHRRMSRSKGGSVAGVITLATGATESDRPSEL